MSRSWDILTDIKDDLASYIETNNPQFRTIIELKFVPDQDLNERGDIDQFHLGLYEKSYQGRIYTGAGDSLDANQSYEIKMFYKIGREGDLDVDVEQRVMNMRDLIEDYCNQLDAGTVTSSKLYFLKFEDNTNPDRQPEYTSMSIDLSGLKDS